MCFLPYSSEYRPLGAGETRPSRPRCGTIQYTRARGVDFWVPAPPLLRGCRSWACRLGLSPLGAEVMQKLSLVRRALGEKNSFSPPGCWTPSPPPFISEVSSRGHRADFPATSLLRHFALGLFPLDRSRVTIVVLTVDLIPPPEPPTLAPQNSVFWDWVRLQQRGLFFARGIRFLRFYYQQ